MTRFNLLALFAFTAVACTDPAKKTPPAPKVSNPHGKTTKPATAKDMGKVKQAVTPPAMTNLPAVSTIQPGDDGDEEFAWQEDVDGDGTLDDCIEINDDETGDVLLACAPYKGDCGDGTSFSGGIFMLQHSDGSGLYAVGASDLCGAGEVLVGCLYDTAGNESSCGVCTVPANGTDFTCE
jgi:hypothetical protein